MAEWHFGLWTLAGVRIGEVLDAHNRSLSLGLNGTETASFQISLDNPIATELTDILGDCLLTVYQDTTLVFVGECTSLEENASGFKRQINRETLLNRALSLPADISTADVRQADDLISQAARGLFEAVTPSDVGDAGMRQSWVNAQVSAKATPQIVVTYDPSQVESDPTLVANFAGPFWRLGKRLVAKSTIPYQPTNERSQIAWSLITAANAESVTTTGADTGIRQGTLGTTISTTAGPWQYKPVAEGLSELAAVSAYAFEFTNLAQDDFSFSGALAARVATQGGTWGSSGDADGYTGTGTDGGVQRTAVSDSAPVTSGGHFATLSTDITGSVMVQADFSTSLVPYSGAFGVVARYADVDNWVAAVIVPFSPDSFVRLYKRVGGGTPTEVSSTSIGLASASTFYTIRLQIDAAGNWTLWLWTTATDPGIPGSLGAPVSGGPDSDMATGGPLEDGRVGLYDSNTDATAVTRLADSFRAARALSYVDDFGFSGNLSTRTAPKGGTWTEVGATGNFTGTGTGTELGIQRTQTGDASRDAGRYAYLGDWVADALYAQVALKFSAGPFDGRMGVIIRGDGTANEWLMASVEPTSPSTLTVRKRVAGGTPTVLATSPLPPLSSEFYNLRLQADTLGNWAAWFWPVNSTADPAAPMLEGEGDTDLASGGALDDSSAQPGIYDANASALASTRTYDTFFAAVPVEPMGWQTLDFSFTPFEPVADTNEWSVAGVKIAEFNADENIGTSRPEVIFEPGLPTDPVFQTEYEVGDFVTARAKKSDFVTARFNGLVRVFRVDVSIDENGKETVAPIFTEA
jgi:hypothetical protein